MNRDRQDDGSESPGGLLKWQERMYPLYGQMMASGRKMMVQNMPTSASKRSMKNKVRSMSEDEFRRITTAMEPDQRVYLSQLIIRSIEGPTREELSCLFDDLD